MRHTLVALLLVASLLAVTQLTAAEETAPAEDTPAAASTPAPPSNEYANPTIGFHVTKPESWHFMSAQQNLENLKQTKLQDKELQAAMLKYATAPLIVIVKHPEPYGDVNPSLKVNIKQLKALSGLIRPWSGSIEFDGERIDGMRPDRIVRRGLVQVTQGKEAYPAMTVEENLLLGAHVCRDRATRARGLERLLDH